MHSFTQKIQKIASSPIRGKSDPRSRTGGVQRRSWAHKAKSNPPSMCFTIPVEQYLQQRNA